MSAPPHILILGLTSFDSVPQREQGLAVELARAGCTVDVIEFAPSIPGRLHTLTHRCFSPLAVDRGFEPPFQGADVRVHTPPILPTGFRNSRTPALDRALIRGWFRRRFRGVPLTDTIVLVMIPLWWEVFDRAFFGCRTLVYDVADALTVQGGTDRALARLRSSETRIGTEADLVTYSAGTMADDIAQLFPSTRSLFLPNAVSDDFVAACARMTHATDPAASRRIGYIGATDGRWFDASLLMEVLRAFPNECVDVLGPVVRSFAERVASFRNVHLHGFVPHASLPAHLRSFSAGIIPFLRNEITRVVNPLKLYEYCAVGLPVVATHTEELAQFGDLMYLADDPPSFVAQLRRALEERDVPLRTRRHAFAASNTWSARARSLLRAVAADGGIA
jgi:glycosyltransferase involved in cell wall biosynthesis